MHSLDLCPVPFGLNTPRRAGLFLENSMRIRSVKPEFWRDSVTGEWPADLSLFFVGLWCVADDEGCFEWDARLIRADIDPFDVKFGGLPKIEALLSRLASAGRVRAYRVDEREYGIIPSFKRHQHPQKPSVRCPIPVPDQYCTGTIPVPIPVSIPVPDQYCTGMQPVCSGEEGRGGDTEVERKGKERRETLASEIREEAADSSRQEEVITESKPKKNGTDPRFAPMRLAWEQTFAQVTREEYRWQGAKDAKAIHSLIAIDLDEFRVRADRGLRAQGFAHCSTVAMLASKWNELAGQTPQRVNGNGRAKTNPSGPHFIPPTPPPPPTGLPEWDAILARYADKAPGTRDYLSESVSPSVVGGILRLKVPDEYRANYVAKHIEDIRALATIPVLIQVAGCDVPF